MLLDDGVSFLMPPHDTVLALLMAPSDTAPSRSPSRKAAGVNKSSVGGPGRFCPSTDKNLFCEKNDNDSVCLNL